MQNTSFKRLNDLYKSITWNDYYQSVAIDLLALITTRDRQAIRIPYILKDNTSIKDLLLNWADDESYYSGYDEYYMVISKRNNVDNIIETDRSTDIHTKKMGALLGYPACCCEWAEIIGESMLDTYEQEILIKRKYTGIWELIDHKLYTKGKCLISHIPCSNNCYKSLQLVMQTIHNINLYKNDYSISEWQYPEIQWLARIIQQSKPHLLTFN